MTPSTEPPADAPDGERLLRPVEPAIDYAHRDRWAVVVGISRYQNEGWNLKYAHRDAEAFYDLIRKPSGGGYQKDHVVMLIDEEATTRNVNKAIRTFLKKPAPEDLVLIYLACHGAPDPDRPDNVYLITYDTDPEDISGTAVPMREITGSLSDNLQAERTIIIADTCHSGVIGDRGLRAADETAPVNRYLQTLSKTQPGLALLTSARANETSRENARWGGGHGVFTHYLLEGMRGEADRSPKNGIVTVEELFEYVREKVHEATGRMQHPYTGPGPVFDWPMAWTGGRSAQEHLQLGHHLSELGRLLDDPGRFESAARQFEDALFFSEMDGAALPEAILGWGRARLAAGKPQEAIAELAKLAASEAADEYPEVHLYLGLAHSELHSPDDAARAMATFRERAPDDERAPWAGEYATWLTKIQTGRRTALLIGINEYQDPAIPDLRGCLHDVLLMEELLRERFDFGQEDIVQLRDAEATRQRVLDEFGRLIETATEWDSVLVQFSGHSMAGWYEPYLFCHDTFVGSRDAWEAGQARDTITARELHTLMNQIPTKHKTLLLDTHPNMPFLNLAREEGEYALMVASSNEVTGEQALERDGEKIWMGHFTWALLERLRAVDPREVTFSQIVFPVQDLVQRFNSKQKPLFIGRRERRLFAEADDYGAAFRFSERRNYRAFRPHDVRSHYNRCRAQVRGPFPAMHFSFGRAFLQYDRWPDAIEALDRCIEQRGGMEPELQLALAVAQTGARRYEEAVTNLQGFAAAVPAAAQAVDAVLPVLEALPQGKKAALLVGIDAYESATVPPLQGAANDVTALKEVLLDRYGFAGEEEDMVVLLNGDATRKRILEEFERLVAQAERCPALFFFSGRGSVDAEDRPTIVSADGRRPGIYDIGLHSLAAAVGDRRANLATVIDAGWTRLREASPGSRTLAPDDPQRRPGERAISMPRPESKSSIQIGQASLYNRSIGESFRTAGADHEQEMVDPHDPGVRRTYGVMTHALVTALWQAEVDDLTYNLLREGMQYSPHAVGDRLDQPVFKPVHIDPAVRRIAGWVERDRVRQMIELLGRAIERRNDHDPEGHLNVGIAMGYLGAYDRAIGALEKALAQRSHYPEARYHLGRLLLESGRDPASAVSELRQAAQADPENVAARYYLGQALRTFVQQDVLVEAEKAFGEYLAGGAPLGQEEEVKAFLESRRAER